MLDALLLFAAAAAPLPATPQVAIDDVAREGIQDWKADGTRGIYILPVIARGWTYARFAQPCSRLLQGYGVVFEFSPTDRLDKDSGIIVGGETCRFDSLTRSGRPPKRARPVHRG